MPVQKIQHARQARHRAELTGRQGHRRRVSPIETQRLVVDVKAQTHGHAGAVRPFPGCQFASGSDRLDSFCDLIGSPLCGWRLLLGLALGREEGPRQRQQRASNSSSPYSLRLKRTAFDRNDLGKDYVLSGRRDQLIQDRFSKHLIAFGDVSRKICRASHADCTRVSCAAHATWDSCVARRDNGMAGGPRFPSSGHPIESLRHEANVTLNQQDEENDRQAKPLDDARGPTSSLSLGAHSER